MRGEGDGAFREKMFNAIAAQRDVHPLDFWKEQANPILRMRNYLKLQGWYTDEEEQELRDLSRQQVLEALVAAVRP